MDSITREALEAKVFWSFSDVRTYYNLSVKETTHLLNMKHCPHAKNATPSGKHRKYTSYKVFAAQFREWAAGGFK